MEYQNVKCVMCKSNNLDIFIRQIIYYDEIPYEYYRCLDCQYQWKQSVESPNV